MSKYRLSRIIQAEINKLNEEIDLKIIWGSVVQEGGSPTQVPRQSVRGLEPTGDLPRRHSAALGACELVRKAIQ